MYFRREIRDTRGPRAASSLRKRRRRRSCLDARKLGEFACTRFGSMLIVPGGFITPLWPDFFSSPTYIVNSLEAYRSGVCRILLLDRFYFEFFLFFFFFFFFWRCYFCCNFKIVSIVQFTYLHRELLAILDICTIFLSIEVYFKCLLADCISLWCL